MPTRSWRNCARPSSTISIIRMRTCAPTAVWSTTCTCIKSRPLPNPNILGITTSWCKPSLAIRHLRPRRNRSAVCGNKGVCLSMNIFGIPLQAMMSQLLLGLVNGSFYAMLSLGLAIIFGLLNVINFAHRTLYMLGAFVAWMGLPYLGLNYWEMLILAPLVVGLFGIVIEKTMLRWLYKLDHLYGLLLTFGITLMVEGIFRSIYGVPG